MGFFNSDDASSKKTAPNVFDVFAQAGQSIGNDAAAVLNRSKTRVPGSWGDKVVDEVVSSLNKDKLPWE